ncbi:WhiB family transcriptional regulator [Actinomycetospora flava]|uniref:WhiB family transcriptional regulator n=1 Tax=Actinomycetospora flava TaxID=3129232 RepID=A0ABU8MF30_9PSEU
MPELAPTDWRDQAACRPNQPAAPDPDLFFPLPGQSTSPALSYCGRCPVRAECLTEAIERGHGGVRGGMTEDSRRQLARTRRRAAAS